MGAQAPVLVQVPALPVPQIKRNPHPPAETVARVCGLQLAEPLTRLEGAIAEAVAAVAELESGRPGVAGTVDGAAWRDAVASDADGAESGERPKRWRTEALLAGEPHRWAQAKALAGAVSLVLRSTAATLDRHKIAATAGTAEQAQATVWARAAQEGWQLALTGRAPGPRFGPARLHSWST